MRRHGGLDPACILADVDIPAIRNTHARDGTRIAYTIIPGASPPWLHIYSIGAPTIELDFSVGARFGYIQNLARGRATVLYDHRGSGFSGAIRGERTLDDLVDDVAAVAAAVGEPMDVSAMGTGCFVAFRYAGSCGTGWRSLVLHGGVEVQYGGSYQDKGQAIWRAGSYLGWLTSAARNSMDVSASEAVAIAQRWAELVPEASMQAYTDAVLPVDMSHEAGRISMPALITSSPRNRGAKEAAGLIPGAVFVSMDLLVNRPELGTEIRELWETHVRPKLAAGEACEAEPAPEFSPREHDVLRLLARGESNAETAARLVVSTRTVERHVQNIYNKLGVHNRTQAANWAREHGVI